VVYKLLFSPHAAKFYRNAPQDLRERLDKALGEIAKSPLHGPRIKRLKGFLKDYYRCRVGNYRVLYAVSSDRHEVYLDYIQHRKDVYRQ